MKSNSKPVNVPKPGLISQRKALSYAMLGKKAK